MVHIPGISCGGRFEFGAVIFVKLVKIGFVCPLVYNFASLASASAAAICVAVAILYCVVSVGLCFAIVRGLEMNVVMIPPVMANEQNAVCGTRSPKIDVAPINGAPSNQNLAQQIVEKAQIFFFSSVTNSTVDVVSIESVVDMAVLEIMAESISSTTRVFPETEREREKERKLFYKIKKI